TAIDPYVARDKIVRLKPDVITLDMEMPRMDGLSFLAKLMRHYPMRVVVLSSLSPKNSKIALKALELGAIEVICKSGAAFSAQDLSRPLVRAIRAAASARIQLDQAAPEAVAEKVNYDNLLAETTHKVVAIGASTGGTKAIETILKGMPAACPGAVIVQHMPEAFTTSFAERLNNMCEMEVHEARDNEYVVPGVALIAPGNYHMVLRRSGANYIVKIKNGPPVHYQKPAVDVLFQSVAKSAGGNAVGVLLTGMGVDGAKGLLSMNECGAYTMAQDEETSIVFGMPKEAIRIGAVDKVFPLQKIPKAIIDALQNHKKANKYSFAGN
ncbi:MAG: chemotaxis response regulator protein-glutamate methylesterase, partial [Deltaproteobacteria bacterium]|nr:chemotaxis response regulator protein-glutamate methylesterase [Deltaproteobacteria bacterium]